MVLSNLIDIEYRSFYNDNGYLYFHAKGGSIMKKRLLSLAMVLCMVLTLLPTTAFAATGTGKGITITTNQAYWSTRILANGTPYSYRPPEAAGRLLYCLNSGLGYHNATPSYCDSYT